MKALARRAREAGRLLSSATPDARTAALRRMADALESRRTEIVAANALDVSAAREQVAAGTMTEALAARLPLTDTKLAALSAGLRNLAEQADPLGVLRRKTRLGKGLVLEQRTVPIGVLLVIFESRPDALVQIVGLAVRSGNALLLKGGKEAARSNQVLHEVLTGALEPLDSACVGLVETRGQISELLELDDVIDLAIPRGGNALVRYVQQNTRIPVLGHADGVCHVYVDAEADPEMAKAVVLDSKTDYPAACNAMETLLIHRDFPDTDGLISALQQAGVTLNGDVHLGLTPPDDYHHEYGDLKAAVHQVDGLDAAIAHIHLYGSGHTESIVTANEATADAFLARVDSASVFHNISTRFADGYRYGLGAEVGISTSRIHARGPVGVEGLLTTRWSARGSGHTVGAVTKGEWEFEHESL